MWQPWSMMKHDKVTSFLSRGMVSRCIIIDTSAFKVLKRVRYWYLLPMTLISWRETSRFHQTHFFKRWYNRLKTCSKTIYMPCSTSKKISTRLNVLEHSLRQRDKLKIMILTCRFKKEIWHKLVKWWRRSRYKCKSVGLLVLTSLIAQSNGLKTVLHQFSRKSQTRSRVMPLISKLLRTETC